MSFGLRIDGVEHLRRRTNSRDVAVTAVEDVGLVYAILELVPIYDHSAVAKRDDDDKGKHISLGLQFFNIVNALEGGNPDGVCDNVASQDGDDPVGVF